MKFHIIILLLAGVLLASCKQHPQLSYINLKGHIENPVNGLTKSQELGPLLFTASYQPSEITALIQSTHYQQTNWASFDSLAKSYENYVYFKLTYEVAPSYKGQVVLQNGDPSYDALQTLALNMGSLAYIRSQNDGKTNPIDHIHSPPFIHGKPGAFLLIFDKASIPSKGKFFLGIDSFNFEEKQFRVWFDRADINKTPRIKRGV